MRVIAGCFWLALPAVLGTAAPARAQGTPPPEAEKVAKGPDAPRDALKLERAPEGTTISLSAGGLISTGNSRLYAGTLNSSYDARYGADGFGASLVGNYGRSAAPGEELETSAENLQGRLRYDRFLLDDASVFMLVTGRHDRLQGIAFRLNLDPGVKYLFLNRPNTATWVELGYDFQYDTRTDEAREVVDDSGMVVDTLDKTATDHSIRVFLGLRQAFNEAVTLSTGLEYLQSFIDSERYRANYEALFTARVAGGFSLGFGFNARFDNAPLPDKEKLDTSTTLSVIYSLSTVAED